MTTEETKENPKKEVVEPEIIVTDSEEIPKGLPPEDMLGDILINGDGKDEEEDDDDDDEDDYEQDEDDENEDEQAEDDDHYDDGQEPRPGESMTDFYNRVQREKDEKTKAEWVNVNNSYQKPNSPPPVEEEEEEAPKGPKKKYEGADDWKNLDDESQEENAIKLTILIDSVSTEALRKFVQMFLVEGKVISEVKMVISNFKKRAASAEFVYIEQEDYIKCLEAYVKLYEQDIPMPNNLKRALAVFFRAELHKWLNKNKDSPLVGVGVALSTWVGDNVIKIMTIKAGVKEPEITQEEDEEEPETFVNIDHIQND